MAAADTPGTSREPPSGGSFDADGDATRRTHLANERTYLAWWRTGLTSLGVAVAVGKIVPPLTSGASWPYEVLGVAFALLGGFFIAYGAMRMRTVREHVRRGEYVHPDERLVAILSAVGILLGIGIALVVLFTR
jgi:putative membrane protein